MRDFLDAILEFIGAETLTDEEFEGIELEDEEYTEETYDVLEAVLQDRENVSDQVERLQAYFEAKGIEIDEDDKPASSEIYLGDDLGD